MTKPMLARPTGEKFRDAVLRAVNDPAVLLDLKMDGKRKLIDLNGSKPKAYNREGGTTDLPVALVDGLRKVGTGPVVLDGELVDGCFWVFDILVEHDLLTRKRIVDNLFTHWNPDPRLLQAVPYAVDIESKVKLAQRVLAENLEGLIAKRIDSAYMPGQRSNAWIKLKYVKSADFIVTRLGVDGKQNMALGVVDHGNIVEVGECSALTGDGPRVQVGDVVEVQYLYVGAGRRLVQPVRPILRNDKPAQECTIDQLEAPKARRQA